MTFDEIYVKYSKLVFNLALQYVQQKEDAEEIAQDVFLSVYKSLKEFQYKSDIQTWIYRITINKSLDFIKTKKRNKVIKFIVAWFQDEQHEIHISSQDFDHPGILLEQKEALQKIFQDINTLPDNQKTAIILSKIEQKSQKEVAEIMNISSKAVESLLQRAKTNLRNKLISNEGK